MPLDAKELVNRKRRGAGLGLVMDAFAQVARHSQCSDCFLPLQPAGATARLSGLVLKTVLAGIFSYTYKHM